MISVALKALASAGIVASMLAVATPPESGTARASVAPPASVALHASFVSVAAPAFLECNASCDLYCPENPNAHIAPSASGASANLRNPHSYCVDLPQCTGHPECEQISQANPDLDFDRLHGLVRAVADGSETAAGELQSAFPALVTYNAERHALQLFGCAEGVVTAHLPLNAGQERAVVAALE